jgi:hypothetical protein
MSKFFSIFRRVNQAPTGKKPALQKLEALQQPWDGQLCCVPAILELILICPKFTDLLKLT